MDLICIMPELTSLAQYLLAITPAFLVSAALLLAVPRTIVLLRVFVHVLFFVLARDAMTAHGYWQVAAGGLRFTAPPLVLLALGAMSLALVAGTCWLESAARRQIRWTGGRPMPSVLLGVAGAMLIVALATGLKALSGLPSLPPVAPAALPLLLLFALAANCYEELLFRGLLQQQLQAWLPAGRARGAGVGPAIRPVPRLPGHHRDAGGRARPRVYRDRGRGGRAGILPCRLAGRGAGAWPGHFCAGRRLGMMPVV